MRKPWALRKKPMFLRKAPIKCEGKGIVLKLLVEKHIDTHIVLLLFLNSFLIMYNPLNSHFIGAFRRNISFLRKAWGFHILVIPVWDTRISPDLLQTKSNFENGITYLKHLQIYKSPHKHTSFCKRPTLTCFSI